MLTTGQLGRKFLIFYYLPFMNENMKFKSRLVKRFVIPTE